MTDRALTPREMIARALELDASATEGPWEIRTGDQRDGHCPLGEGLYIDVEGVGPIAFASSGDRSDAAFIAASRALLPSLARELAAALDRIARVEALRQNYIAAMNEAADRGDIEEEDRCEGGAALIWQALREAPESPPAATAKVP